MSRQVQRTASRRQLQSSDDADNGDIGLDIIVGYHEDVTDKSTTHRGQLEEEHRMAETRVHVNTSRSQSWRSRRPQNGHGPFEWNAVI